MTVANRTLPAVRPAGHRAGFGCLPSQTKPEATICL